jgi:hypothetical protein
MIQIMEYIKELHPAEMHEGGMSFQDWLVIDRKVVLVRSGKRYTRALLCRCTKCGKEKYVRRHPMMMGRTNNCGCVRNAQESKMNGCRRNPKEYSAWLSMRDRCYNPNAKQFKNYGARGIRVCERWMKNFTAFYEDMGNSPEGMTLDRIDNNGDYEPGNCRWASHKQQNRNKRDNAFLELNGERRTVAEWAEYLGVGYSTLHERKRAGWTEEEILTTPVRRKARRRE